MKVALFPVLVVLELILVSLANIKAIYNFDFLIISITFMY